jgi:hypothetical protein
MDDLRKEAETLVQRTADLETEALRRKERNKAQRMVTLRDQLRQAPFHEQLGHARTHCNSCVRCCYAVLEMDYTQACADIRPSLESYRETGEFRDNSGGR